MRRYNACAHSLNLTQITSHFERRRARFALSESELLFGNQNLVPTLQVCSGSKLACHGSQNFLPWFARHHFRNVREYPSKRETVAHRDTQGHARKPRAPLPGKGLVVVGRVLLQLVITIGVTHYGYKSPKWVITRLAEPLTKYPALSRTPPFRFPLPLIHGLETGGVVVEEGFPNFQVYSDSASLVVWWFWSPGGESQFTLKSQRFKAPPNHQSKPPTPLGQTLTLRT